jgi:hypothetical protein
VNRTRTSVILFLASIPFLFGPLPARAAKGDTAFLHGLDSSGFPQIKAYLAASNALGARPAGLTARDLTVTEDGAPVRNLTVAEERTGVRLIVVIDPGVELLYTLPEGGTRIELIRRTMENWLKALPDGGMDDLTLITPEGTTVSHSSDPAELLKGLGAYIPKVPAARPLGNLLTDAVSAVSDPSLRPGMRAFLLVFSASALSRAGDVGAGVCPRAMELHATLFGVWSGRVESSSRPDMEALGAIASSCGGYSVALESDTGPATVLSAIAGQRMQYRLEFRSAAFTSDPHSLMAAVKKTDFEAETAPAQYSVTVQPPRVEWVDFPEGLVRKGGVSKSVREYQPDSAFFRAEVTFPDGHPRTITAMQLFADSQLVSECTAAPCEGVTWDLRDYSPTGSVGLRIVVRDELGLTGQTVEREITVRIEGPSALEIFRARYLLPSVILLAILAAFGVLAAMAANYRKLQVAQEASELLFPHPGPASVARPGWGAALRKKFPRASPAPAGAEAESYILLESLADGRRTEIAVRDALVGREESSAIRLEDPSVSPRHARIVYMGDGAPWVFDLGSTAGSWRNFEEVPPQGVPLREGDRLNFGRAAFRVSLKPCASGREKKG